MKRIGILSDTHGIFDQPLRKFFEDVDELWHAGDFGSIETADAIAAFRPLYGVYGNIDGGQTRVAFRRWELFECEQVPVMITHIGGYPGHYASGVEMQLRMHRPKIFVCGHSHILKVMYDKKKSLLHINPGAAGIAGFHQVRTAIRLVIDGEDIRELEVGEWPRRPTS